MNSYLATLFTFIITLVFLRLMYFLVQRGVIASNVGRAIIQVGTGPVFVLCWLMYPDVQNGRWLAALISLAATVYFILIGTGVVRDDAAIKAMTRTGIRSEVLRGPLLYSLVLVAITLIYWKDSLVGIPALALMAGGIGSAELLGLRNISPGIPWSLGKSIARAVSTFVGGWLLSIIIFAIYIWMGTFSGPLSRFLLPVTWIALGAGLVELLPIQGIDNIVVPIICALIGFVVF